MYNKDGSLNCDMDAECRATVTHLGEKGYVYCNGHVADRRGWESCRKLQAWERRWLLAGKALPSYKVGPEPVTGVSLEE